MDAGEFEIRLLGPFGVRQRGRSAGPAGSKRRGLLALLALQAGRVVPVSELIDGLWGEAPPASAANLVQTYVSAWRKALEADWAARGGSSRIVTLGPGYRLYVMAGELDLKQCGDLLARGRRAAAAGRNADAAGLLSGALELWRGPPLADLAREPFYPAAAERLNELYLQVVEAWAAAALAAGNGDDVAAVLRQPQERAPFRERLCELLMWALFQEGRQADALAVYEDIRRVLADELGADPGPGLRDMHLRVLRQDAALRVTATGPTLHNLPLLADSFIDREPESRQVTALLAAHRLVTLTGTGGSGKTRMAIEVAAGQVANEDVFFVDAGPLVDAALLPERVASVLGVRPAAGQSILQALSAELARWQLLIVLDNLEHLAGAAPVVTGLLSVAPKLRLLVTSREPLHARGEQLYPVPPLAVRPAAGDPAGAVAPAIALFADRAGAADPHFVLSPDMMPVAAGICRELDGLPLAIELAVAWLRLLPPARLLARLDRRLDLLADARSDRPGRQQTLRAAIDWSYQLLDAPARRAYRALGVFRGGWTLTGAAAVCAQPDETRLLVTLMELADKNLIEKADSITGEERFRMLETLREYAVEQLSLHGEDEACCGRHADYIATLAADSGPQLTGADQSLHLDRLEAERDNISAALRWLHSAGRIDEGLRISGALWRFWHLRTHLQEGSQLLEDLLSAPSEQTGPAARAAGLAAAGSLAYWQLDYGAAQQRYAQALSCFQQAGDAAGIAEAHYNLGFTTQFAGDSHKARGLFEAAAREYDNLGDELGHLNALTGTALVDHVTGNTERALQQAQASLQRFRALGDRFAADNCLSLLGSILRVQGNLSEAGTILREALAAHDEAGNLSGIVWMLHELAGIAFSRNQTERALRLAGAASRMQGQGGTVPVEQLPLGRPSSRASGQPGMPAETPAWRAGQQMSRSEAVAEALSELPPSSTAEFPAMLTAPNSQAPQAPPGLGQLSPRERELVTLVARGRTDAQIAEQLYISVSTVRSHLDRIRDKTGSRRRADLTRLALQAGLV
jgi:predicted ATPase/DNA-binding SARP family transcriptional activator/DNA-binding CsgD family transcriptional regulator